MEKSQIGKAVVLPGYREKATDGQLLMVVGMFRSQGFDVLPVDIDWENTGMPEWVTQVRNELADVDEPIGCVFGFSFGALIAAMIGHDPRVESVILASPSAYLKDDLPRLGLGSLVSVDRAAVESFKKIDRTTLYGGIRCKAEVIVGERDWHTIPPASAEVMRVLKRFEVPSELHVAKDAEHDLTSGQYPTEIVKRIKKLCEE